VATNIAEIFVQAAEQCSDRTGIIEAKSGKSITFGQLNNRSDGYSHYLTEKGVRPGDVVVLMVTPSIEFICLTLALFKLGAPIVLIDPGMGYKNLLRCIARVQPRVLVGIGKAVMFAKIFKQPFATVEKYFCCGNSFGIFGPDISRCLPATTRPAPVYQPGEDDLAAIIFTTGSTGPPKGVRYEHGVFSAQLRLIREYYGIGPADVDQPAFPLFALFSAALGACSVIPDMDPTRPARVDPKKFVASIDRYGVTYSFGSPAIWNVVSRYCLDQGIILESLRKVLMAGAPVPYELLQRVTAILQPAAVIATPYGATESLPVASIDGREVLGDTWKWSRQGRGTCVGRALPGIDLRIMTIADGPLAELDQGMLLATGAIGEIIVRGEVVTRAYQNNPGETELAKIREGDSLWHRMGDIGYLDDQQRLWFCGRRAHRVVTATGTLFTIPCEAIINEHPDVYRSALVGVRGGDASGPARAVIIVEPRHDRGIDRKKLLVEVRALASRSELTRRIKHFLVHDGFPVDIRHNAKIFREKLGQWAEKRILPQG
jgi:acyl-CoA synthetase (AMP-forming)/AMP-acid ligase II